jgi:hypothetical protein
MSYASRKVIFPGAIPHRHAAIWICTLRTGGERHSLGEIPEYENVLPTVNSTLAVGDTLGPMIFTSNGMNLAYFARDRN